MSNDSCDPDVYKYGESCGMHVMTGQQAEARCKELSEETGDKYDWHYVAGRVHLKVLKKDAPRYKPEEKIAQLEAENATQALTIKWYETQFKPPVQPPTQQWLDSQEKAGE
tara:strand:+ start:8315 stop:8647 length:333 start_codon:yes stop_codon:yes gene_type:complete